MSDAPKRIYAGEYNTGTSMIRNGFWVKTDTNSGIVFTPLTPFIRADLVDKLIEYTRHDGVCKYGLVSHLFGGPAIPFPCTCGLSDLIKEVHEK